MNSDAATNSPTDWLGVAVQRGYLSAEQSAELTDEAVRSGWAVRQLAVERGLLTPLECDIVAALVEPSQVAPGYCILDVIGHGGLGIVYRAQQINLDRPVALKTVLVTQLNTPGALARFQQEAKTIGGLRHPNIVAAFDCGTNADRLFLAMELVEGLDLAKMIQRETRIDEFRGLWIARQIAGGLAHAAERNIVHRDIKPANILITKTPEGYALPPGVPLAKITDFGLALLARDNDDTRLTLAGTTMGTPRYMAPEQLAGSTVDHRADIFSLGATLYHMLTGSAPFAGATFTEVVANRVSGNRRHMDTMAGLLSAPTVRLVEQMLADNPADRPADYGQLMARIDEAIQGANQPAAMGETALFVAARPGTGGADSAFATVGSDPGATRTMVSDVTVSSKVRRVHWGKRIALVAIILAGIGAALWSAAKIWHQGPTATEPPVASAGGREVPLFDGSTLTGWEPRFRGSWGQGRDAEGGYILQGRAAPTQAASIVRELPTIGEQRLENFRVQLDVDPREAQRVDIVFGEKLPSTGANGLRLEKGSLRVGAFDKESNFQPTASVNDPPLANHDGPVYRNIKIDHYAGQWRVYVDDRLIGKLPTASGAGPFWISLVVDQGAANFENLQIVELAQDRK
ncbi:MAG: serine/threonine protein kinase [Planctomycetia bacterium]|nr:serine/threonine protein kinase [Planctomycetia bacterium]